MPHRLIALGLVVASTTLVPKVESAFTTETRPGASRIAAAAQFAPRNITPPAIAGTAREGETLTATAGTWARATTTPRIEWVRCEGAFCAVVGEGTTREVTPVDVGRRLHVRVTATNGGGSTTRESAPTAIVRPRPPANTVAPAIAGSLAVGDVVSAVDGTWSGAPTSFAHRWLRCTATCSAIAGGTEREHLLTGDDVDATLKVEVTATNAGGSTTATSAAAGPIARASFTQILCRNPDDGTFVAADGALPDGVTFGSDVSQFPSPAAATRCASGSAGIPLSTGGGWTVSSPNAGGWLQYRAGTSLEFAGGTLYRHGVMSGDFSWVVEMATSPAVFTSPRAELCSWGSGCSSRGSSATPFGDANRVDVPRGAINGFNVDVLCDIPAGRTCVADGAIVRVFGAKVTLRDTASPVVVAGPTGGLVTHASLQPTEDVVFSATDSGGGLYRVRVRIGSQEVATRVLSVNGGRCADVNPGNGDPYEFASRQPCPATASPSLQFDTTSWPKTGRLRVLLEDAGRNTTLLVNRELG